MKAFVSLTAVCLAASLYCQSIQDFQFIAIPPQSKDFSNNQYGLFSRLKQQLEKKNYTVITVEKALWPQEMLGENCNYATAGLVNASSMFRNKVNVVFKNCQNQEITVLKGESLEKDFEAGYTDALQKALTGLPASAPKVLAPTKTQISTKAIALTDQPAASAAKAQLYSLGNIRLHRINISGMQFILTTTDSSVPYAVFSQSLKAGVYRVKLQDGTSTLGYTEGDNIVIEQPQADGTYRALLLTALP